MHHNPFEQRLQTYQATLAAGQAVLLSYPSDITYFTGFSFLVPEEREALLVITPQLSYLIHTSFAELPQSVPVTLLSGCSLPRFKDHISAIVEKNQLTTIAVDTTSLFVNEYQVLEQLPTVKVTPLDKKQLWLWRSIKDDAEITALTEAGRVANAAWLSVSAQLAAGMTELDVQWLLEAEMKKLGSQRPAFPTIVCFGASSALPHHQPTLTPLTPNQAILVDFGATVNGYRSDMTRSQWFGDQPTPTYIHVAEVVKQAYDLVFDQLKSANCTAQQLDKTARDFITQAGYGSQFIHTTGHGVGLDIHEPPSLYWNNAAPIPAHMVITIEPGIYLPGEFGIRYENTVLVTAHGGQELTSGRELTSPQK